MCRKPIGHGLFLRCLLGDAGGDACVGIGLDFLLRMTGFVIPGGMQWSVGIFPLFSQCDPAGRRPVKTGDQQIIIVARSAPQIPHCTGGGIRSDGGSSARSGRAKQRSLLCPLSERGWRHLLLFAVLDLLVLLDQDKSTRRKKMHDRRNRFSGKNSDVKIGCVVSAGRRPWDTPTVAGLRRRRLQPARRKGPQYFKPDCGVSQGRNLACTARCSVNSRKVRSSRRFPPVPLRSDRHDAPPINNGNRFL